MGESSEAAILRRLRAAARRKPPEGIGDDAAVIHRTGGHQGGCLLAATDLLVEGVDFDRRYASFRSVGWKAAAAALSDIAAMGGKPLCILCSLALDRADAAAAGPILAGVRALAKKYRTSLRGGDLSETSGPAVIDIAALGTADRPIPRAGAHPGDLLCVTGDLGGAAEGLKLLRGGARLRGSRGTRRRLLRRQLLPEPRLDIAPTIACVATAMIDISDGLVRDLTRLCRESRVGVDLDAARLPIAPGIPKTSRLEAALYGGEDYELLFTVKQRHASRMGRLGARIIGRIRRRRSVRLLGRDGTSRPLENRGFEHFA